MQAVFCDLAKAAAGDQPVLITGPPGSGKSLAAWMLHIHSSHRSQSFHGFDFRAIPLVEAMQAASANVHAITQARGGTLVIDGATLIPDVSLHELVSLSGVRVVLTADCNHDGWIDPAWVNRCGIATVISITPLRTRMEDLVPIAKNILQLQANRTSRTLGLSPQTLSIMSRHSWPGNIRELSDNLSGAIDRASSSVIRPEHLAIRTPADNIAVEVQLLAMADVALDAGKGHGLARWRDQVDDILLTRALERTGGNLGQAAALLGITRPTLRKRCAELGLSGRTLGRTFALLNQSARTQSDCRCHQQPRL